MHDLPVSDSVGEDVSLPNGGVIMRTGLALTEPGDDARVAEPSKQSEDEAQDPTPTCGHSWSDEDLSGTAGILGTHTQGPGQTQTLSHNLPRAEWINSVHPYSY